MTKQITLPDDKAMELYTYLVMKGVSCYFTVPTEHHFTVFYDDSANSMIERMVEEVVSGERDWTEVFE
jgi:hypothetical protein